MRHEQTDLNAKATGGQAEVLRGNLNVPINAAGIADAYRSASMICEKYPVVEVRATPDFLRASMTRDIVAHVCGVPAVDAPELAPYNPGSLSGQAVAVIEEIIGYLMDFPFLAAPGGGDTYAGWYSNWENYFHQVYSEFGGDDTRAVVLIVFGMELRALAHITEGKPIERYERQSVKPGQYVVVH